MSDSGKWNTDLMPRVAIIVVCAAVVAGAVFWLLPAHRFGPTSAQNAASTTTGQGSWAASQSAPASGNVSASGSAGATGAGAGAGSGSGATGASVGSPRGGSTTRSTPRPKPPSADVLGKLRPGEWQLYGARVVSAGTPLTTSGRLDVTGIEIDCEAATKVSGGYGHASVQLSFSASGPTSGKGPWSNAKGVVIAASVADLHGPGNNITKQTALTEKGTVVNGRARDIQ